MIMININFNNYIKVLNETGIDFKINNKYIGKIGPLDDNNGQRLVLDTYEDNNCGAYLELRKSSDSINPGGFTLSARNLNNSTHIRLVGTLSGHLTWNDKNIVRSVNGINADDNGNVTLNNISGSMPIGSIYFQLSGQSDPTSLFGGTWQNVSSSYAGLFFRAEGGSAAAFGNNQSGGSPNITGTLVSWYDVGNFSETQYGVFYADPTAATNRYSGSTTSSTAYLRVNFDASRSSSLYGAATEVRPINSTIRIWKRTG